MILSDYSDSPQITTEFFTNYNFSYPFQFTPDYCRSIIPQRFIPDLTLHLLLKLIHLDDVDSVKQLLDLGASANECYKGSLPLDSAVSMEMVELLLSFGADPTRLNPKDGRSKANFCSFNHNKHHFITLC